jgi:spore coat protein U-like protein
VFFTEDFLSLAWSLLFLWTTFQTKLKNLKSRRNTKMKKSLVLMLAMGLVLVLGGVAMAGDTATVEVTANVVGVCKFLTGGTMAFGDLDPSTGLDKDATVTQPTFWCTKGSTYTISDDKGGNASGNQRRVKHNSLTEYINYSMNYTTTGTGTGRTGTLGMNISGTITSANYQNASVGGYADTVTLTINP